MKIAVLGLGFMQGNIGGPGERMDFSRVNRYTDALEALRAGRVLMSCGTRGWARWR